jgi:tRNA (guanine-N7-)-methyltransferase
MTTDHDAIKTPPQPAPHSPLERKIRSYTLRQGRLTEGQRKALESLWPVFGLEPGQPFYAEAAFGRQAPLVVEIGFGNGEALAQAASLSPETNFLGIEVHRPGVGHLFLRLQERGITNVRVYCADAVAILSDKLPDHGLAGINLFFPDPWPKKRHHKRRLVDHDFARLVASKLVPGGLFHAATDWEDYARQMQEVLESCDTLVREEGQGALASRARPRTKFEERGERLGHGVWDLLFARR